MLPFVGHSAPNQHGELTMNRMKNGMSYLSLVKKHFILVIQLTSWVNLEDYFSNQFGNRLVIRSQVIYPAMRRIIGYYRIMEHFKISSIGTFCSHFLANFTDIQNSYLRPCTHIKCLTVNSPNFSNFTISICAIEIFQPIYRQAFFSRFARSLWF